MTVEKKKMQIKKIFDADEVEVSDENLNELVEHIDKHEYFLGQEIKFPFTWDDALFSWYENIYRQIRSYMKSKVLRFCFKKQEIDLFFGISHEWYMISSERKPFVKEAVKNFIFFHSKKNIIIKRICEFLI